ncbi:MAG: NAD(P)-dependent oxidoreductase [Geodermatophilaceae bacterium]|nr:NAD(P)-dependent oxidoreductase [Geodermatophilaceae bacterium]MDQ3455441.1 NAD(P)-dependent oxidoreductase [Actinomycetota bacterium]
MAGSLVFGGAGFIGTHLLRDLVARGVDPVVSADIADPREPVPGVDYRYADVRQAIQLDGSPYDTIYNLAGLVATPGHPDGEYYRTNVTGAVTVTDFADAHGIRTIVFTSTMSIYPTGNELKTEQSALEPLNAYGASKALGESIHRRWQAGHADNRLVVARPAVIFGPGERGNFQRLHRLIRRGLFVYPGRKDTVKACGYVTDLVASFEFVLGLPGNSHVYNFAYPDRCTIGDICQLISAELDKPEPRALLPLPVMRAGALPFEALESAGLRTGISRTRIEKLVESTNIYPQFLLDQGFRFPTTLSEGIHRWAQSLGTDHTRR